MAGKDVARAAVYTGPEKFEVREFPLPALGDGDMLVEVMLAGVDGSEVHMFKGEIESINNQAPVIFGDEIIGKVVAAGKDACAKRGLKIGDRIAVEARWPCNNCPNCERGQYYLCRNGNWNGYGGRTAAEPPHLWGGYATHVFVPEAALTYLIPENLPTKTALMGCSLLANSKRWVDMAKVAPGSRVLIVGPGPQGIGCAFAAKEAGASVIVVGLEKDARRLGFCKDVVGTDTEVFGAGQTAIDLATAIQQKYGEIDTVIEAAGAVSAKELAFEVVRPGGTAIHVSIPSPQTQPLDWMRKLLKEMTIISPASHPHYAGKGIALASRLLEQGIDVGDVVSDVLPLDKCEEAILTAAYVGGRDPLKVAIDPKL